ncbi:MAG: M20/M25/M40 family metallo-hydrolase [Oscillospiraceae bacterium]|nr:M20/M25/M40 family metallo-hydrolase [Oscillospiraceae bacterium]
MYNETMHKELIELLTTDSASGRETAVAELLIGKLKALGFTVTTDNAGETFGGECGNVLGVLEGQLDGSLFLCSHMDRVPNGLGIQPVEKDGILYSDGTTILAADDISGVCAILEGLRRALSTGKPLPRLEVYFTVGEEAGLYGAKATDVSIFHSRMGYIFDSPGRVGRFVTAAPGRYQLGAEITGLAAHAGNEPEKGIDAAKIMCDMLSSLKQGRLDPVTTSNFPILSTGTKAPNVVCDFASFSGEARSRDTRTLEEYVAYFEAHCRQVAEEKGAGLKLIKKQGFLPFRIPESDEPVVVAKAACAKLGLSASFEAGGGGMDANIFNARGMATIGVATGYSKNHTKSEQLILEDFYKSGELAQVLIETFAERCGSK